MIPTKENRTLVEDYRQYFERKGVRFVIKADGSVSVAKFTKGTKVYEYHYTHEECKGMTDLYDACRVATKY